MMYKNWPDFDELKRMADNAPEQLEAFRKKEIDSVIANAPTNIKRRLEGLQFQIDCQRQIHKTPLGACVAISKMMRDSLAELNAALNGSAPNQPYEKPESDNVIPFAG